MSSIPAQVWAHILPCPTLSVTHFLHFPFPSQLPKSSTKQDLHTFWSSKKPNVLEFTAETLKDLPILSAAVLSALISTTHTFHESSSIVYAHLPNQLHFYYPPWFLNYWVTVSSLHEHVILGYEVENIFTILLQFFNREISHFLLTADQLFKRNCDRDNSPKLFSSSASVTHDQKRWSY